MSVTRSSSNSRSSVDAGVSFDAPQTFDLLVTDEWRAKAYAEYLEGVAKRQGELLSMSCDIISSDDLTALTLQLTEQVREDAAQIKRYINEYCYDHGATVADEFTIGGLLSQQAFEQLKTERDLPEYQRLLDEYYPIASLYTDNVEDFYTFLDAADQLPFIMEKVGEGEYIRSNTSAFRALRERVSALINDEGQLAEMPYTAPMGCAPLADLLTVSCIGTNTSGDDSGVEISVSDGFGSPHTVTFYRDEIIAFMRDSYASTCAWAAGFYSSLRNNVSDAVNEFTSRVSLTIQDITGKFASIVSQVRQNLSDCVGSVKSFFQTAYDQLGWKDWMEGTFSSIDKTKVWAYTGASPLASVVWTSSRSLLTATWNTAMNAAAVVVTSAWNVAKNVLWPKIRPWVKSLTEDAEDITISDSDDVSYTVQDWSYNIPESTDSSKAEYGSVRVVLKDATNVEFNTQTARQTSMTAYRYLTEEADLNSVFSLNQWITMDTYLGVLSFEPYDIYVHPTAEHPSGETFWPGGLTLTCHVTFKPKCLNYESLLDSGFLSSIGDGADGTKIAYAQYLTDLWISTHADEWDQLSSSGQIYSDDASSEEKKYAGFYMSTILFGQFARTMLRSMTDQTSVWRALTGRGERPLFYTETSIGAVDNDLPNLGDGYWMDTDALSGCLGGFHYYVATGEPVSSPSNFNFLEVTSGVRTSPSISTRFSFDRVILSQLENVGGDMQLVPGRQRSIASFVSPAISIWISARLNKALSPSSYVFIPYVTNSTSSSSGRYRIRTDAENANMANAMFTVLVVAGLSVAIIGAVKGIKAARYFSAKRKQGMLDQAMWNGDKLSMLQKLQYRSASKKVANYESALGGLVGGVLSSDASSSAIGALRTAVFGSDSGLTSGSATGDEATFLRVYQAITGQ